jgi:DNA-directed RNA polymerase specialized sigma24 family protein
MHTDQPIGHGYTLTDLHDMASHACAYDRSLASDAYTRYSVAWSAIAEALINAPHWPRREELVRVGWQAIYREVREMRHTFGFRNRDASNGVGSAPRFAQFWYAPVYTFEDDLIERRAVPAIMATLTDSERAAVVALAVFDDYHLAADSLGLKLSTFTVRLSAARRRFRRRWYAPDTPPPITHTDRRVGTHPVPVGAAS